MNPQTQDSARFDAVVIGAGAGGLSAAARLAAAGKKVLVAERLDRLGGRASSENIDGHIVNIGAIAIERGGLFEETFNLVGVPLDLREPNPATVFYIDGKVINVAKGGWGMPGCPLDFQGTERQAVRGAPRLGQHTEEVLSELLGVSGAAYGALHDRGVVATPT